MEIHILWVIFTLTKEGFFCLDENSFVQLRDVSSGGRAADF